MIVEATTPTDVRTAVLTARERDLPFVVYATGHGGPVPAEDAVVVRTARLGGVLVDPERRMARSGSVPAGPMWSPPRHRSAWRHCRVPRRRSG